VLQGIRKGQGLIEFALIAPFLLLLILGIIEAGLIIFAYATVQIAARDAARYAVTGQPSIVPVDIETKTGAGSLCQDPEGEAGALVDPWLCEPQDRVEAIKEVAFRRGRFLAMETECEFIESPDPDKPGESKWVWDPTCYNTPGAFGVRVEGQIIDATRSLTMPRPVENHPGSPGLNLQVEAFYNVQMLDPIYNAVFNFIRLSGKVDMQNEGIDTALGALPPPSIDTSREFHDELDLELPDPPTVEPLDDAVFPGSILPVRLTKHVPDIGYDVYLSNDSGTYRICENVAIVAEPLETSCLVPPTNILPGLYFIYSTQANFAEPYGPGVKQVEVLAAPDAPKIAISGGDTWAAYSWIDIELINHNPLKGPFDLYLVNNDGSDAQEIKKDVSIGGDPTIVSWQIDLAGVDLATLCPPGSEAPCFIQSRLSPLNGGSVYPQRKDWARIYISQPEIVLLGGQLSSYAQGETIYMVLRGHTPGLSYDLKISGTGDDGKLAQLCLGTTQPVDSSGTTFDTPLAWTVIVEDIDWPNGWPNGLYDITSHPASGSCDTNQVAVLKDVRVETPTGPYLTVDGGYTWPIGSWINIKVHRHSPGNYYLEFGPDRIIWQNKDNFDIGVKETPIIGYRIPLATTVNVEKTVVISSFDNSNDKLVAERSVRVLPKPVIRVLEGKAVLAGTTITIRLTGHAPTSSYKVIYAGTQLFSVVTDDAGEATRTYNLADFPTALAQGVPHKMFSERNLAPFDEVANTLLTIRGGDLALAKVEVPKVNLDPVVPITVPVTFTIKNLEPVAINRYFDIDLYADPFPLIPSLAYSVPGIKHWKNSVAPAGQAGDTFTIIQNFPLVSYGDHKFYGFADTSDFVAETNHANNILSNTLTLACSLLPVVEEDFAVSTSLPDGWSSQPLGNADAKPIAANGTLIVESYGSGNWGGSDNSLFVHNTEPISSDSGLDVRVQLRQAPNNAIGAGAGLELRNTLAANSIKVDFGLVSIGSNYLLQAVYREADGSGTTGLGLSTFSGNPDGTLPTPIWLRVEREAGSDTFNFYYRQQAGEPTEAQWSATSVYATANVSMSNQVYAGVYNVTFADGAHEIAEFDDFTVLATTCTAALTAGDGQQPPPGFTVCTSPLSENGFEDPPLNHWFWPTDSGVAVVESSSVAPAPGGNYILRAPSFDGGTFNPSFNQEFVMPTWIISTETTIQLSLHKYVDTSDPDENDRFYAVIATAPNLSSTILAGPVEIANGADGTDISNWPLGTVGMPINSNINLEDFTGQAVFLYLYNNSNSLGACSGNCQTKFYFDNVNLTSCTRQPSPLDDPVANKDVTHIKGDLTLLRSSGAEKPAGVKVWAYAENSEVQETFTLANGEFNFYNLAPGTYFIYAEHYFQDPFDESQIEILTANIQVVLTRDNTISNPTEAKITLQTVFQ
jgi:hypothetical protein